MSLSIEILAFILVVGVGVAWLAEKAGYAPGFGPLGDAAIGVFGAFDGVWLVSRRPDLATGTVGTIVAAAICAALLLLIGRLFALWWTASAKTAIRAEAAQKSRRAAMPGTPATASGTAAIPERPVARAGRSGR